MTVLETRLLELLARGPLTADEIADHLHCAANTVWGLLAPLRKDGTVTIAFVKNRGFRGGSGRGKAIYQLTKAS